MRKLISGILCLFILSITASAQDITITGIVKDEEGKPLPSATILNTRTKRSVISNSTGQFTILARI
jgi:ABC-type spermidine/putrescine transport system permease subunit II